VPYSHIPSRYVESVSTFLSGFLTPYPNDHRSCFFPEARLGEKGRQRRLYRNEHVSTPYERFKSIPDVERFLKSGLNFATLDIHALAMTGNQAVEPLNRERGKLFQRIRSKNAA